MLHVYKSQCFFSLFPRACIKFAELQICDSETLLLRARGTILDAIMYLTKADKGGRFNRSEAVSSNPSCKHAQGSEDSLNLGTVCNITGTYCKAYRLLFSLHQLSS